MIENNRMWSNKEEGVRIEEDAAPHVRQNKMKVNEGGGMRVKGRATGTIEENAISFNHKSGIQFEDEAAPILQKNTMRQNVGSGIKIGGKGQGAMVRQNEVDGNTEHGVVVSDGAQPQILDNSVHRNKGYGIMFRGRASGTISHNRLHSNQTLEEAQAAKAQANSELLNSAGEAGFHPTSSAGPDSRTDDTEADRNEGGVELMGEAKPDIRSNVVYAKSPPGRPPPEHGVPHDVLMPQAEPGGGYTAAEPPDGGYV